MVFKLEPGDAAVMGVAAAQNSVDKANMMMASADNTGRIAELEHVVAFLLARLVMGQPVTLNDDPIRRFLRVPPEAAADPARYVQAALSNVAPRAMLDCPQCHSKVKDIPGFTQERCLVCGYLIGSKE